MVLKLVVQLAFATFALSACSVARESLRQTYNPTKVEVGLSRQTIESELGTPDHVFPLSGDLYQVDYSTSKVTPMAKDDQVNSKVLGDAVLLGAVEIANPFGLADDSRWKRFIVFYNVDDVAAQIQIECSHDGRTPIIIDASGKPSECWSDMAHFPNNGQLPLSGK